MTLKTIIKVPVNNCLAKKAESRILMKPKMVAIFEENIHHPGKLVLIGCSMGFKIGYTGINVLSYTFVLL